MKVKHYTTVEREIAISGITLLSVDEFKAYSKIISEGDNSWELPGYLDAWWLRTPGTGIRNVGNVATVGVYGVDEHGKRAYIARLYVRPALMISGLDVSGMKVEDKFNAYGYNWTILSDRLALCDEPIANAHRFNEEYRKGDTNNYETSDIKRFIEGWLSERMREETNE